jgi:CRP-like cAMP-binding protein
MALDPFLVRLRQLTALDSDDEAFVRHMMRNTGSVPPDRQLKAEGDQPTHVHVVLDGLACRYKILADGRRQILAFMVPGDPCDFQVFLLEHMDHSIGTLTPSVVATVTRHEIETTLDERPAIARAFWLSTMRDEAVLREWLVNVGRRNAYERMAHLLWELYLRHAIVGKVSEDTFYLPLTQADLADALGLSTVYVNKTITRLRASGIIETDRRQIRILEPAELSTIAGFDASYLHLRRFSHEAMEVIRRPKLGRL